MEYDSSVGWELKWKAVDGIKIVMGGARPEFRLSGDTIFGYPRETSDGGLRLPVTTEQQDQLLIDGDGLEVWSSGRRVDGSNGSNIFRPVQSRSYNSKPPKTPTTNVNPAALGTFATKRLSYDLAPVTNVSGFFFPLEVLAEVTYPLSATGMLPLVLFLHGRHSFCYKPGDEFYYSEWPCSDGGLPIPSHLGYRYVTDILASQGYVAVSISANSINAQDYKVADAGASARSILIRHHLKLWALWSSGKLMDPFQGLFKGKVDMNKVVLVGHSRGGEGVNRAAVDTATIDPYKIVGLVSYGPTAFLRQVRPDIHAVIILPTCDGDVSDLQGQAYVDESRDVARSEALRSAVIAYGTNHNYYNIEWTPGLAVAPSNDDWYNQDDPYCGSNATGTQRLTPQEQQLVGAAYTCALVRFTVKDDAQMLSLLDGSYIKPKSIGRAEVAVSAVGGANYALLYYPKGNSTVRLQNGMSGSECTGQGNPYEENDLKNNVSNTICGNGEFSYRSPHWLSSYFVPQRPPMAMELKWARRSGASANFAMPSTNLTGLNSINIRVANDPNRPPVRLEIWIRDNLGNNSTLNTSLAAVDGWPGIDQLDRVHARTLRGDLKSARPQVNLNSVVEIALVARSLAGRVWVFDIAVSQARIQKPAVLDIPILSVLSVNVSEKNGGSVELQIVSDRPFKSPGSILVQRGQDSYQLDIPVGSRKIGSKTRLTWLDDKIYTPPSLDLGYTIQLATLRGAIIGNYEGKIAIIEDEPAPILSVIAANVVGIEGRNLEWTFRLSSPTVSVSYYLAAVPPTGTELDSSDVDRAWLASLGGSLPATPVPLSSLYLGLRINFDYGQTISVLRIPLSLDKRAESDESVKLELSNFENDPTIPANGIVLTGRVRAHK